MRTTTSAHHVPARPISPTLDGESNDNRLRDARQVVRRGYMPG